MGESFGSVTISTSYYDDLKQCERLWKSVDSVTLDECGRSQHLFTTSEKLKATLIENKELTKKSKEDRFKVLQIQASFNVVNSIIEKQREEIKELKEGTEIDRLKQELSECIKDIQFTEKLYKRAQQEAEEYLKIIVSIVNDFNYFNLLKFKKLSRTSSYTTQEAHEIIMKNKS